MAERQEPGSGSPMSTCRACAAESFGVTKLSRPRADLERLAGGLGLSRPFGLAQRFAPTAPATLTGHDGAISGFNAEQLLKRLERRPLSGGGNFRSGSTPYDTLNVAVKFADGIATAEDVRVEGPAARLTLTGTASVPAREFDLKGTASLTTAANAAPGFDLPFVVQGPWDDPLDLPRPRKPDPPLAGECAAARCGQGSQDAGCGEECAGAIHRRRQDRDAGGRGTGERAGGGGCEGELRGGGVRVWRSR